MAQNHVILESTGHLGLKNSVAAEKSGLAIKFDLSEIPKGVFIDLAELRIRMDSDTTLGKTINVIVHPAHSTWNASALASTNRPTVSDTMFTNNFVPTGEDKFLEVNVTELVRLWYDGKFDNNGFVVSVRNNVEKRIVARKSGGKVQAVLSLHYSKE